MAWTIVLWDDARQLATEAELPAEFIPEEELPPEALFRSLRDAAEDAHALSFIAAALPRREAIEWGLAAIPEPPGGDRDSLSRRLLRDAAYRWLDDPEDTNRRALFDLAEEAREDWPEKLIALAVFFSGGSIAPPDHDHVPADPSICATLVSAAVLASMAEHIQNDPDLLARALELADEVARHGREVLARA
ncbi:MAG: hypothetical protein V2I39_12545 [Erythrobacter sp.]|jgi:hypothetical protein|nr:hypothetical protein [Erythrobacter sp.]